MVLPLLRFEECSIPFCGSEACILEERVVSRRRRVRMTRLGRNGRHFA